MLIYGITGASKPKSRQGCTIMLPEARRNRSIARSHCSWLCSMELTCTGILPLDDSSVRLPHRFVLTMVS
jgi:hypothetical protein